MAGIKRSSLPKTPRYQKLSVDLPSRSLTLYAGSKVRSALKEVTTDMNLYHGVRLGQVLEAVYEQGMKDGRKDIIEQMEAIRNKAKYLPPGRPQKAQRRP